MSPEKTFFSYSRDDSEFVLKLATDLRTAGIDIWLDQLDIVAGRRWDAEIEKALEGAETMIVILSPTSVASNNVMDEVSYALEEGKRVIPILISECEIPFRIKRLQRVDFTGDYEPALKKLVNALNLKKTKEPEKVPGISKDEDIVKQNEEKASIEQGQKQELQTEENLWLKSKSDNTISSYQYYLEKTKLGKYKDEASDLITKIKKESQVKRGDRFKVENDPIKTKEKDRGTSRTNNDNIRWK